MTAPVLEITISNELAELARFVELIDAHGEAHGWSHQWMFNLNLVLDELITNVISYGYDDSATHEIHITLTEGKDSLVTVVEDDGRAFDPFHDAPEPDLSLDLPDRPIGGLGVHLVKALIDQVSYERRDDRNCVTLLQQGTK